MELIDKMFQFPHTGKIQRKELIQLQILGVFQFPHTGKIQGTVEFIVEEELVSIPTHG